MKHSEREGRDYLREYRKCHRRRERRAACSLHRHGQRKKVSINRLAPYNSPNMSVKGSHITTPLTEHVREVLPDIRVAVFRITFGVEAVYLNRTTKRRWLLKVRHEVRTYRRDLPTFVIPAQQRHSVRIAELETREQRYRFDAEGAAIDVVALQKCTNQQGSDEQPQSCRDPLAAKNNLHWALLWATRCKKALSFC